MKLLSDAFKAALEKEVLTLTWCWLVERKDGVKLGFTAFDLPLLIDGVVYQPTTGFSPGAIQTSQGTDNIDTQNLAGILDATGISERDLNAGLHDCAKVRIFLVDYTNSPTDIDLVPPRHLEMSMGLFSGIKKSDRGFEIQTKSKLSLMENNIGEATSQTCRTWLGSPACGVNLAPYTHNLTVTAIANNRIFAVDGDLADKYFDRGRLIFTSGENNGVERDIAFYVANQIILLEPLPFAVFPGDTLTAIAGCAKTKLACLRYNNVRRFQGEPDIPTNDKIIDTPTER